MHKLLCLALLAATLAAAPARAAPDDTLYQALGQRAGIAVMMDDFVVRLKADGRIGHFFKDTKSQHLSQQLTDQLCQVAGGPCKLDGPNMKIAHQDMEIGKGDFNALVEVLQASMDARAVPFATQNRLLAVLAPMHRDIINKP